MYIKQKAIDDIQQKLIKMNDYRYGQIKIEEFKTNFDIEEFMKDLKTTRTTARASLMDVTIPHGGIKKIKQIQRP